MNTKAEDDDDNAHLMRNISNIKYELFKFTDLTQKVTLLLTNQSID